jgi:hypothetical protein
MARGPLLSVPWLWFYFIEISFIQRFTLFLGHPLAAIGIVLAAFLVFAGVGSGFSAQFVRYQRAAIVLAAAGIIAFASAYLIALPALLSALITLPLLAKAAITLLLIAPLGFADGPAISPWA